MNAVPRIGAYRVLHERAAFRVPLAVLAGWLFFQVVCACGMRMAHGR
jgi:hypothetical protein